MHKLDHLSFGNCTFLELKLVPNKNVEDNSIPDISFVNAHSECDSGHNDWNLSPAQLKTDRMNFGIRSKSEMRENSESRCEG